MAASVSFHDLNPVSFLDRSTMVFPNKTAVVYKDVQFTYAEFDDRVNRLAGALKVAGGVSVPQHSADAGGPLRAHANRGRAGGDQLSALGP